jgi:hypothetical protein
MSHIIIKNNGSCGICGYIWQVLRAIYHYPGREYYINFSDNCQYSDPAITSTDNVWEYYFEQPNNNDYPAEALVETTITDIIDVPESEFRDVFMVNPTAEYIQTRRNEYNKIINQHIKLLPTVEEKIRNFTDKHFKGKRVLGVHFRGTDHPDKKYVTEYLQAIGTKAASYDVIFCASDEAHRVQALVNSFGDKVVTYDSIRSETAEPLHYSNTPKFKIGEDVIIEAYLMANTHFLFCCGNSNVNYLARAINPNLLSQVL